MYLKSEKELGNLKNRSMLWGFPFFGRFGHFLFTRITKIVQKPRFFPILGGAQKSRNKGCSLIFLRFRLRNGKCEILTDLKGDSLIFAPKFKIGKLTINEINK